jgi:hypothetical protein
MTVTKFATRPRSISRNAVWLSALALIASACGADDGQADQAPEESASGSASDPVALPQAETSPGEDVPSALDNMNDDAFPEPLIDPEQILSGGPPPDGIPAIDEPKFTKASEIDGLGDDEALLMVSIDADTRGYPFRILTWHEIVNDTVGDVPVAVTYCPLCNSGIAFDRRVDGKVLDFGTSGRLHASNLVMYDRQTESLWPQFTGQAAVGVMTGAQLEFIPASPIGWSDFREAHPDAWVLSSDTGYTRDYGRNPYVGYDTDPNRDPLFGAPAADDRLPPMERIIALQGEGETAAVRRSAVENAGTLATDLGEQRLVLFFAPGQASALESGAVAGGRDIGTVAVFRAQADGQDLTFSVASSAKEGVTFVDEQTGSTWNIFGQAIDGPREGESLEAYPFVDTFWKSWVSFAPDTRITES